MVRNINEFVLYQPVIQTNNTRTYKQALLCDGYERFVILIKISYYYVAIDVQTF